MGLENILQFNQKEEEGKFCVIKIMLFKILKLMTNYKFVNIDQR